MQLQQLRTFGLSAYTFFILIRPLNLRSAFGNAELSADHKILRTGLFCQPLLSIFLGNLLPRDIIQQLPFLPK